jgi:hypothetical protein
MNDTQPNDPIPALPDGYSYVRLLSERNTTTVALTSVPGGGYRVVKRMKITGEVDPEEVLARHRRLQKLTEHESLLTMLDCGLLADKTWLWESFPLADHLDGAFPADPFLYTPQTLRLRVIERGPLGVQATLRVGVSLCDAIERLHQAGLVHRDIKPGNILIVDGTPQLGDYGLVSEPGRPFNFQGTEGFQPTSGGADPTADLFALGKTLYELWTGSDRLEFPSLPKLVLEDPDWAVCGNGLNALLLRACHSDAKQRFADAQEFRAGLVELLDPVPKGGSRRRWIAGVFAGAATASLGGWGALHLHQRRRATQLVARWEKVRTWDHLPDRLNPHPMSVDAIDQRIYTLFVAPAGCLFYTIDLRTLQTTVKKIEAPFVSISEHDRWHLHPVERTLWRLEGALGYVWRFDPRTGELEKMGEETKSDLNTGNATYWNPVTQRLGVMGGYGWYRVHNRRSEFDAVRREWVQMESPEPLPWGRVNPKLVGHTDKPCMFLFGGEGNASGDQGKHDPRFKYFTGHFDALGDLWSFDFISNAWTNLVPLPGLELGSDYSLFFFPPMDALVVPHQTIVTDPHDTPARVHVYRPGTDRGFVEALSVGTVPTGKYGAYMGCYDPVGKRLLYFGEAGIWSLVLEAG